jgi:hypothetical protein
VVVINRASMADLDRREELDALVEAHQMREYRGWLIGEVASGVIALEGIFDAHDMNKHRGTVKVVVLAEKVPGVGKVRARRAMEWLGIAEDARWGEVDRSTLRALWAAMADAAARPVHAPRRGQSSAPSSASER